MADLVDRGRKGTVALELQHLDTHGLRIISYEYLDLRVIIAASALARFELEAHVQGNNYPSRTGKALFV